MGLGWSWAAYNQGMTLGDYPMNKIGEFSGVRWIDGYITDPVNNIEGSTLFLTFFPNIIFLNRPLIVPIYLTVINTKTSKKMLSFAWFILLKYFFLIDKIIIKKGSKRISNKTANKLITGVLNINELFESNQHNHSYKR